MLTFLLAMSAIVVFSTSVSAASSDPLTVTANTAAALPGGRATVTFSLANNPGFSYLSLTADYDGSVMTLQSASNKNLFGSDADFVAGPSVAQKPYRMIWSAADNVYDEGELISLTFTVAAKTSPGTYPVTLKVTECSDEYGDNVTTFGSVKGYVKVRPKTDSVASVSLKKKPSKLTYEVGDTFDPSGMALTATYTDNMTAEITEGYTCTPTQLTTAGEQKIVVSFGGKTTGFYVTVKTVNLSSVTLKTKPTKQTYIVGETFDSKGMVLKANYDNGKSVEVTSGFTCTPTKLSTVGQQKIVVTYGGKSTGFYVTVNKVPEIASIAIKSKPTKQVYYAGESFASAGMKLTVSYDDGSKKEVSGGFTCTPSGKLTTVGQQKIVVSYGGKSTGFYVTVTTAAQAVSSVVLTAKPAKQVYAAGETFNASGMKLKVTYADNTTAEVTSGFTCTPSGKLTTVGQQKIVVTYGGKSTGFYVTVNKKVTSVTIKAKPSKLTYNVRDTLDTTGMKLGVTYSDNTTAEVTSGFTCTPTKLTTAGTQTVTVKYGDASAAFGVTVNRTVTSIAIKSKPSKLTYIVGSTLDTSGLKLTAAYSDNTSREITANFTCSPTKLNTVGTQKITVHYGPASTTFDVTVTEDPNLKTISVTRSYTYAYEVLKLVNEERSKAGVKPALKMDASLLDTAMMRSGEIVLLFSHTRPDGSSCFSAFKDDSTSSGENIAAGYQTPAAVVEGWMNSEGHRANILNPNFTTIGIGCVKHDSLYQIYWTQCFGNHLTSDASVNSHKDGTVTQKIKIDPSIVNG